ncbi:MAG TPA: response regulator [Burkholderiaceae bacterium]|jgi:two-component system OmpR family response regulator/two-component system response regulator QseB|nr:response regulator [Burkholderiaceae bacterium]
MRVLLVEDDRMIGESIRAALRQDGSAVDWVRDGRNAENVLATEQFDLVLLDLGLPQRDGLEILRAMRLRHNQTPVIVLTARDALQDRVAGLDAGADDYLVKPFELEELAARIRAVSRRKAGRGEPAIEVGEVRLDPSMRQVTRAGEPVVLSAREYAVLEALMARPGAILSRGQLEDRLYGWGDAIESNAVSVYIHQLRRKLGNDFIRNVRGVGYYVGRPEASR